MVSLPHEMNRRAYKVFFHGWTCNVWLNMAFISKVPIRKLHLKVIRRNLVKAALKKDKCLFSKHIFIPSINFISKLRL